MSKKLASLIVVSAWMFAFACGPSPVPEQGGADSGPGVADGGKPDGSFVFIDAAVVEVPDARTADVSSVYPDATSAQVDAAHTCTEATCQNPVQPGCTATEICNNGSDDNCNGKVDEGCSCTPGAVQACFAYAPGFRHVGACKDGSQTCVGSGEFPAWGPCTGGITPHAETCDSLDNDCNGCADDDPQCCQVNELKCPSTMPEGAPFQDYVINGSTFFSGTVASWAWTVTGGPCDQLLAPSVSYTLSGQNTNTLTFRPTLSGDYTVRVVMTEPDGTKHECTFIVHIAGPGFRVELCWDTTGITGDDVDLHVHKPGDTTNWFTANGSGDNNSDCFYQNCKALGSINWGYAASPIAECAGGPEGPAWQLTGSCRNPRLDMDNINTPGKPENMNIDKPVNGSKYRVAVHHFSGNGPSHPLVNVYCGGTLRATYGQAPDLVPGFTAGGGYAKGPIWRVVDVTPQVNAAGVTTGCTLAPLTGGTGQLFNVTCGGSATCVNNAY